jgi:lipopolysaccharide biosynthesis regulator YciM
MQAYEDKKFGETIVLLSKGFENDDAAQFYLGMSYLYTQQTDNAIPILAGIAHDSQHVLNEEAAQYLPIAYIAKGEVQKAKELLTALATQPKYALFAQKLLNELGN